MGSRDYSQDFLRGQHKTVLAICPSDEHVSPEMDVHLGPSCVALISQALPTWAQCWELGIKSLLILQTSAWFEEV